MPVADEKDAGTGGGESTLTVLVAMAANAGIGVLKLVAGLFTGSAAMFAEAAHSVADTATEGLLLTALRRSAREPDREHPVTRPRGIAEAAVDRGADAPSQDPARQLRDVHVQVHALLTAMPFKERVA